MRVGCIIQARLGSTRLPRKILADVGGWPMLRHVVHRIELVGIPLVVASPMEDQVEICKAWSGFQVVAPECDADDVLLRYLLTAKIYGLDGIMRVTGDCPLIDPAICSRVLHVFNSGYFDYVANDVWPSYPHGLGCEVFTRASLEDANRHTNGENARGKSDREHVTQWIRRGLNLNGGRWFCGLNLRCPITGVSDLQFSVNTPEDLERVRAIDAKLPDGHLKFALETTLGAAC